MLNEKKGLTIINGQVLKISKCGTTLNVLNTRMKKNKKFNASYKVRKKYAVHHSKKFEVNVGDDINFYAIPPISKTKKWICSDIVRRVKS